MSSQREVKPDPVQMLDYRGHMSVRRVCPGAKLADRSLRLGRSILKKLGASNHVQCGLPTAELVHCQE